MQGRSWPSIPIDPDLLFTVTASLCCFILGVGCIYRLLICCARQIILLNEQQQQQQSVPTVLQPQNDAANVEEESATATVFHRPPTPFVSADEITENAV